MSMNKGHHDSDKKLGGKVSKKKYEKPGLTKKSRVPNAPAAWGSYQP
ncbi:MAG: hypothetical protein PHN49_04080 [Candidatus Omnitrophica bacterium]|nr:hypothetical protein [Candidatus Omnitrophota bacterium]MDD5670799.1 hypothetical protein [Candidatus Omnitrophota bacterium]